MPAISRASAGRSTWSCAPRSSSISENPRERSTRSPPCGRVEAVLTVPHEPYFRLSNLASGANVTRWGNDPEHVQHFGPRSFRALLSTRFDVLMLDTSYPWILALAAPR